MRLALVHLWKEWRAQRAILIAYSGLIFACLCLGLWLAPARNWREESFGVHALSWFVAAGVIGVVGFAAPGLVRGEFGQKDDQFVRRLPGALAPAFGGKLLFLLLATALLPLLGLLLGELFVTAVGGNWNDLWRWSWKDPGVTWNPPSLAAWCGAGLLALPWIWAVGTCMPGGRMAVLGTVLFALVLGVVVGAVLAQSPNIVNGFDWQSWLWTVPLSGLMVGTISWTKGRRGGGAGRSARFGLLATGLVLVPPSAWLGERMWCYRHPDLGSLQHLSVRGIDPTGRHVLAEGAGGTNWASVPVRIDLATGEAQQIGGLYWQASPDFGPTRRWAWSFQSRHWLAWTGPDSWLALDLATGATLPLGAARHRAELALPEETRTVMREELRATTMLRGPGGERAWVDAGRLFVQPPDGAVQELTWPFEPDAVVAPAGHGMMVSRGGDSRWFDLTRREASPIERRTNVCFVRGRLLSQQENRSAHWLLRTPDGAEQECDALRQAHLLGLFDDDRVLFARYSHARRGPGGLFLFDPATGEVTDIRLPVAADTFYRARVLQPVQCPRSLLARDPEGRVWLHVQHVQHGKVEMVLRLGDDLHAEPLSEGCFSESKETLIDWQALPRIVVQRGDTIERVDVETGARELLFPRR